MLLLMKRYKDKFIVFIDLAIVLFIMDVIQNEVDTVESTDVSTSVSTNSVSTNSAGPVIDTTSKPKAVGFIRALMIPVSRDIHIISSMNKCITTR